MSYPPLCGYRCSGFWWVRFFGWGLCGKRLAQHRLLFSERVLGQGFRIGGWHFRWLGRTA